MAMVDQLIRALLLSIRDSEEYDAFSQADKKRFNEIMAFVGGEEIDEFLKELLELPQGNYQLKVTLKGVKPPIWRRIVVPAHYSFRDLHLVIQEAMGWEQMHLYSFFKDNVFIEELDEWDEPSADSPFPVIRKADAREMLIGSFLAEAGDKCDYIYDFGDDWIHSVQLEKVLQEDDNLTVPICLKGKRACPPENCGGIPGYENLLAILKGPDNEEKEMMLDWLGEQFDSEAFDIDFVNMQLRTLVDSEEKDVFFDFH